MVVASGVYEVRLTSMRVPRLLLTPFMMGLPLGKPGDEDTHQKVVSTALSLFDRADGDQPMVEFFTS